MDRLWQAPGGGGVNALGQRIAALIAAQGPITVAQFMTMALHDPQYGYYAVNDPLGDGGDFLTAPEITQIFGELLGLWAAQCWHDQGKPPSARLVELGPGRGTLMCDALRAAKLMPAFSAAIEVVLVETNPVLQKAQEATLAECGLKIRWSPTFDATLTDRPLFLLANEFFDALPIRQFVKTDRGWCERMVGLDTNGGLAFALAPAASSIAIPMDRGPAELGAVYEAAPAATAVMEDVARTIAQKGGAALVVDYGYGANAGFGETFQAIGEHQFKPLLDEPGTVDLSAHVDFGALARAARENGAVSYGPANQGDFLIDLGSVGRGERLGQMMQVDRLTNPVQMGALFKALAILPNGAPKPAGF
ncbi:MAG TPA: SAM-dependent methyltransferase [Rhizomicrobium sp.]|nr:SAM-dependent methyltransferase [Rhizomicrobium sp.]